MRRDTEKAILKKAKYIAWSEGVERVFFSRKSKGYDKDKKVVIEKNWNITTD